MKRLRVIFKPVGKPAEVGYIEDGLKPIQDFIQGWMENVRVGRHDDVYLALIVNDCGALPVEQNPAYAGRTEALLVNVLPQPDYPIHGPIIFSAYNLEGESVDVPEDIVPFWVNRLNEIAVQYPEVN